MTDDLASLDAVATAELVRTGELTPAEVVEAAIARAEKLNPQLNAIIHERFDKARDEAQGALPDGPLRGVPVVIKDLHGEMAGEPYHCGVKAARDAGYRGTRDAVLVERIRAAGAVVIGRTNVPEFGLVPTTEPVAYGPSLNPWDTGRSTGGSSGGSAAAVASGIVAVGHANDGGGSIRIPASECGLVGLKPSRGRVPSWPDDAESWAGLSADLVVTRTVRDTAALLDVMGGFHPGDLHTPPSSSRPYRDELTAAPPRLHVGICTDPPDGTTVVDPQVIAAVEIAARTLTDLGHTVERGAPPALAKPDLVNSVLPCIGTWALGDIEDMGTRLGRPLTPDDVEPATWAIADIGRSTSVTQYLDALRALHRYGSELQQWWYDGWDLLVTPTIPEPPLELGQFGSPDNPLAGVFRSAAVVPFTIPFNISGQPAISLPLATTADGLPIGVQLVAAYGREDVLIRIASQLEQARPWAARRPPLSA
jgi:amidase